QRIHPITEFPIEDWRLINTLMLEAPFVLTKAALPKMCERGWGRIINLSSIHGLRASPNKSAYVAAKHGLTGLTKATALEAGPHGVTCNAINPGYVLTPLVKGQIADQATANGISEDEVLDQVFLGHSAVPKLAEPDDIAAIALFLAGEHAAVVNGSAHSIDGGWSAACALPCPGVPAAGRLSPAAARYPAVTRHPGRGPRAGQRTSSTLRTPELRSDS